MNQTVFILFGLVRFLKIERIRFPFLYFFTFGFRFSQIGIDSDTSCFQYVSFVKICSIATFFFLKLVRVIDVFCTIAVSSPDSVTSGNINQSSCFESSSKLDNSHNFHGKSQKLGTSATCFLAYEVNLVVSWTLVYILPRFCRFT